MPIDKSQILTQQCKAFSERVDTLTTSCKHLRFSVLQNKLGKDELVEQVDSLKKELMDQVKKGEKLTKTLHGHIVCVKESQPIAQSRKKPLYKYLQRTLNQLFSNKEKISNGKHNLEHEINALNDIDISSIQKIEESKVDLSIGDVAFKLLELSRRLKQTYISIFQNLGIDLQPLGWTGFLGKLALTPPKSLKSRMEDFFHSIKDLDLEAIEKDKENLEKKRKEFEEEIFVLKQQKLSLENIRTYFEAAKIYFSPKIEKATTQQIKVDMPLLAKNIQGTENFLKRNEKSMEAILENQNLAIQALEEKIKELETVYRDQIRYQIDRGGYWRTVRNLFITPISGVREPEKDEAALLEFFKQEKLPLLEGQSPEEAMKLFCDNYIQDKANYSSLAEKLRAKQEEEKTSPE